MKNTILAIAFSAVGVLQAQNPGISEQDREFVTCASMDNLMEMKLSEMGSNKGFSPEVKELATHMMNDHKKTDATLTQLASARSMTVATRLDEEREKDLKKLSDKEGEDFDMAFTEYVIKSHKKAIDAYEKEAKKGENTELRAFANNSLTGLNHHKNMADETCKKLKKKK